MLLETDNSSESCKTTLGPNRESKENVLIQLGGRVLFIYSSIYLF